MCRCGRNGGKVRTGTVCILYLPPTDQTYPVKLIQLFPHCGCWCLIQALSCCARVLAVMNLERQTMS